MSRLMSATILVPVGQGRVVGEPVAAEQPLLLARDPEERDAPRRPRALADRLGDLQQGAGARGVVVGAVEDHALVVDPHVVVVGAEDDDFLLLLGVGAGEEAEDVALLLGLLAATNENLARTPSAERPFSGPWGCRSCRTRGRGRSRPASATGSTLRRPRVIEGRPKQVAERIGARGRPLRGPAAGR